MKIISIFQTLLFTLLISINLNAQEDQKVYVEDYNQDGFNDSLIVSWSSGSGFGSYTGELICGKTKDVFTLSTGGCFCEIYRTVLIHPELRKSENMEFFNALKDEMLPPERNKLDPSLNWLISSLFNYKKLERDDYFDLIIEPNIAWTQGKLFLPDRYSYKVSGDTLNKVYHPEFEVPEWFDNESLGYITYGPYNHIIYHQDTFEHVLSNKKYDLIRTAHGIVVQTAEKFKWLFISDYNLTGAPEKLRWPSIEDIVFDGDYIFVKQSLRPFSVYNLYIINIESGKLARFKYLLFENSPHGEDTNEEPFLIKDGYLILNDGEEPMELNLKSLYERFESI